MNRNQSRYTHLLLVGLLLLLSALACGLSGDEPAAAPPEVVTVVVIATDIPVEEPLPGEPVASSEEEETAVVDAPVLELPPIESGQPTMTALVDLNVRRGPGTGYAVVGVLRAGNSAPVIGQNANGSWWKIECPPGIGGDCWASAGHQFSSAENVSGVLVVAAPPLPTHPPATAVANVTATATATAAAAATATATATATYPPTTATYVASLPTNTPTATPPTQPTATATATPPSQATATPTSAAVNTPTPTYTPSPTAAAGPPIAPFDGDSINNPAVFVNFSPTGQREFTYNNDISSPEGDTEDWVQFNTVASQSPTTRVWLSVSCDGYDAASEQWLRVTLWDGFNEQLTLNARCGDVEKQLTVTPNHTYNARIHFSSSAAPYYVQYSLTVRGRQ